MAVFLPPTEGRDGPGPAGIFVPVDGFRRRSVSVLSPSHPAPRGFSLLELAVALALAGLLALVASGSFSYVRERASARSAAPLLLAGQLEVRRAAGTDGTYPADLLTALLGVTRPVFVEGPVDSLDEVSLSRVASDVVVLAAASGSGCLVLVDRPYGSSTWALAPAASGSACSASALAAPAAALAHQGTADSPQELSTGG